MAFSTAAESASSSALLTCTVQPTIGTQFVRLRGAVARLCLGVDSAFALASRSGHTNAGDAAGSYPARCPVRRVVGLVYLSSVSPKTSRQSAARPGS
jgi:hypothetical protein